MKNSINIINNKAVNNTKQMQATVRLSFTELKCNHIIAGVYI